MCAQISSPSQGSNLSSSTKGHPQLPGRVLFAHGNGFPARTYSTFLRALAPSSLRYVPLFGHDRLGQPCTSEQAALSAQLLDCLGKSSEPVLGVGHSLGAVLSLQAYYLCPSAFSKLVLMDPPLFGPTKQAVIWVAQQLGCVDRVIPPARKAKRRRTHWTNQADACEFLQDKPLFQKFHPSALQDYLKYGLKPTPEGGTTLAFSQEIEYQIFCRPPLRLPLLPVRIPCYLLYSASYEACSRSDIRYLAQQLPGIRFIPISAGHMFPMEQPKETAYLIHRLLK